MTLAAIEGSNSQIPVYNKFRDRLAELRELNESVTFDYEDPKGNKDARSHVYMLRKERAAVEDARKEEKAASLEYGRMVDAQAKEIMAEIEALMDVHLKPIEEIEQREKDRVAKLEADLVEIEEGARRTAEEWDTLPLEAMKDRLAEIEAEELGEDRWQEYAARAEHAKTTALAVIRDAIARREKHEAEQAELERLRKEEEARKQAEREEQIRKEAEEKARREAAETAEKAQREAEEREQRLKEEAARAEREKVEAEERAKKAAQEERECLEREAKAKAEKEAAEAAKREANKRHRAKINNAAVAALVEGGLSDAAAKTAVTLIAQGAVPAVTITY